MKKRLYEMIPGILCWLTLVLPFFLGIFFPHFLIYFIVLYVLYWLYKTLLMGFHLVLGYCHLRYDLRTDWSEKLKELKNLPQYLQKLQNQIKKQKFFTKIKTLEELREATELKNSHQPLLDSEKIYQAVILPTYKEDVSILRASIRACQKSLWPKERMIIVLATEAREKEKAKEKARILTEEFGKAFFHFLVTEHSDNLVGEMKAKGANLTWAARKLKKFLDEKKIPYENVLVSAFDADTRPHPQYFACLTYKYLLNPARLRRSYQPIPLYSNNIWEISLLTRITAFSSTFWQMIEATRPYRMVNFSSQALSMQTLVEIDFWDVGIVSEDSRQFFRAFFRYGGDHQVVPLFTPVYMDAVYGETFFETLRRQYLQKRRWAYGVEHFPYLCQELPRHPEIPFLKKFLVLWRQFEGHYSWATASILLFIFGWIPFAFSPYFQSSVMAYNLPNLARFLLSLTWIGLIISTYISLALLPPRPTSYGFGKTAILYIEWIFVAITAIIFGSIPAIDAQTHLMLGKYLGFWVTPKAYSQTKG